ncbi:MAG: peptidase [Alphaproteobacteria bacterium]|nr:peptidase [Alphaproteobacteria bacterium]
MTYCLAIKIKDGIVALSDSRISSGRQVTNARKVSRFQGQGGDFLLMTSGLRSVRDKTVAYLDKAFSDGTLPRPAAMLDAAGAYAACLRRVAKEDRTAIRDSNLSFDLHTLLCGRLCDDKEPAVYLIYPEGNWVEIAERTPYLSIGATAYGKPILDRALRFETPMLTAIKLAYLSFDSTRTSSADVGFPIDILVYYMANDRWYEGHYDYEDLQQQRQWWNERLTSLAQEMPPGPWSEDLLPENAGRLTLVGGEK